MASRWTANPAAAGFFMSAASPSSSASLPAQLKEPLAVEKPLQREFLSIDGMEPHLGYPKALVRGNNLPASILKPLPRTG